AGGTDPSGLGVILDVRLRQLVPEANYADGGRSPVAPLKGVGGHLSCPHSQHARRARGVSSTRRAEASVAGEYPTLFSASVAWMLSTEGKRGVDEDALRRALRSSAARDLERATRACSRRWRAAPELMPAAWEEREDALAGRADDERAAELKFISMRRAERERDDVLAREELPGRGEPPRIEARPPMQRVEWPRAAPERPIRIDQLFYPGV
ncbi:MAG: hypothetical protein SGPRY_013630, partial [Prymnesium sp.]